MVNEPSVFEPLKFYCISLEKQSMSDVTNDGNKDKSDTKDWNNIFLFNDIFHSFNLDVSYNDSHTRTAAVNRATLN